MNAWHYYFHLRRSGYSPHMACVCALMNGCSAYEFRRRLDRMARWLNGRDYARA